MRMNPNLNIKNNNKKSNPHPSPSKRIRRTSSRRKNQRNPRKNRPILYPSTPKRISEGETLPTSRPSRVASRLKNYKRRSFILIQLKIPLPLAMTQALRVKVRKKKPNPSQRRQKYKSLLSKNRRNLRNQRSNKKKRNLKHC